jgi:hypothetical protein
MGSNDKTSDRATWWQDRAQKGRSLAEEISALAARARAAGFETTEYILGLALAELWKEIDRENGSKE